MVQPALGLRSVVSAPGAEDRFSNALGEHLGAGAEGKRTRVSSMQVAGDVAAADRERSRG